MIAVVILHYQNAKVTRECIKFLMELDYDENFYVIVVDNASPNGTGVVLKNEYANNDNIKFILLDKNEGFAAGNNIGYKYAKETIGADTILIINSDLFIKDKHFLHKLDHEIKSNPNDSIIAVDIVSKYGGHQNPFRYHATSTKKQKQIIARKRVGQILYSVPILNTYLISRKPETSTAKNVKKDNKERLDIIPHGACVIYTPRWVETEEKAFLPGTFLFVEEEILYDYCADKNKIIHYIPHLEVYHMEDASQESVSETAVAKKKSQLRFEIESRKILLKYRKEYIKSKQ